MSRENDYQKRWNAANPSRAKLNNLRSVAKRGGYAAPTITPEQLDARIAEHDGLCDICGCQKPLDFDHNHENGDARGFLCRSCNLGLGHFRSKTEVLLRAVHYLTR